jgi:hypothetical protein
VNVSASAIVEIPSEAAVGTPASRSAAFMATLSRQSPSGARGGAGDGAALADASGGKHVSLDHGLEAVDPEPPLGLAHGPFEMELVGDGDDLLIALEPAFVSSSSQS